MNETLYDRFRPFKPYDRMLAASVVLMIAANGNISPLERLLVVAGGLVLFTLSDQVQRRIRVPTPLGQSLTIVAFNTAVVSFMTGHLQAGHRLAVPLYLLNVTFAAAAFGSPIGLVTASASAVSLALMDIMTGMSFRPWTEWALTAVLLTTMVALVHRVQILQRDALTDVLTGLRNHRYFQIRLREELARTQRTGRPTGLALIDLDNFKKVNDLRGHAAGDHVLRRVARILEQNCRAFDLICRYGGEELTVIMPESQAEDSLHIAERLRQSIEEAFRGEIGLTASIGVTVATEPQEAESVIARADEALYAAKNAGKNQVRLWSSAAVGITTSSHPPPPSAQKPLPT